MPLVLNNDGSTKSSEHALVLTQDKPVPKLLLPFIQANLRLGKMSKTEDNHIQYIKIPINVL